MLSIQSTSILAFLATTTLVSAHGHITSWVVNGEVKAGFNPSNAAEYGKTAERPTDNSDQGFTDYTAGIVACGGNSAGSGLETWDLDAGSTVTAKWNTWPDSHKGPVTEYMAKCPTSGCDGVSAASLDWFKIAEDSYDGSAWASDKIVSGLSWDFKIPGDLAPGPYLVRHSILAMHTTGGPQVYPVCFQANLISSGTGQPGITVKSPAAYNINDSFKTFSIYGDNASKLAFVPPGPAVRVSGGGGATLPPIVTSPVTTSTKPVATTTSTKSVTPSSLKAVSSVAVTTSKSAVSTSKAPVASSSAPVTPPSSGSGSVLGGPTPPVTAVGDKFQMNGQTYNFKADAITASCYVQMNNCRDAANKLPNAQVSAGFTRCDTQFTSCTIAGGKRDVIQRYAKRPVNCCLGQIGFG